MLQKFKDTLGSIFSFGEELGVNKTGKKTYFPKTLQKNRDFRKYEIWFSKELLTKGFQVENM